MEKLLDRLSPDQRELLSTWLPGMRVVGDLGWGLVDNHVFEVEDDGERYVVKADGADSRQLQREIDAHERWLAPWVAQGRAPRLVAHDRDARILVTRFLPGELVQGHRAQDEPDTFRRAGELLSWLHEQPGQPGYVDDDYEAAENAKVLGNLDKTHRVAPDIEARVRDLVASWPTPPVPVVPTHGDYQPRNWLVHDGRISVIDLGRAALRPAATDWLRLAARDFSRDPALEAAFVEGYGGDPREPEAWFREQVREATNTAVWAHLVGDEGFEAEGHAMLDRLLARR